jgi:MoxR-like ATPase
MALPTSTVIHQHTVHLAEPIAPPDCKFEGRKEEIELALAAWAVDPNTYTLNDEATPLHFCLQGPPGVGKNELVYELARRMHLPLYMVHGHEDISPEDLSLLMVPDVRLSGSAAIPLVLRASPLATALYLGGIVFFDEINRVPERALAPLASVLDARQSIYSSAVGISIGPRNADARRSFRFCCALNPELSRAGQDLPDYIQQRTLPVIRLERFGPAELIQIVGRRIKCRDSVLEAFAEAYEKAAKHDLSLRQAMAIVAFAANYERQGGGSAKLAVDLGFKMSGLP